MRFADHFSHEPDQYASFRPRYPSALFAWISSLCSRHELAWDCATGNGQAAEGLAAHFARVVATDASAAQIRRATPHPRVEYRGAPAGASGLDAGSVDLVTVAQALHWLPRKVFYAETRRVLRREGVLAAWGYHIALTGDDRIDREIRHFHDVIVGPHWPPERRLVLDRFTTIDFPFEEIAAPAFEIRSDITRAAFTAYLRTQSAVLYYRQAHGGQDPVELFERAVDPYWPADEIRTVIWPLFARVGRGSG